MLSIRPRTRFEFTFVRMLLYNNCKETVTLNFITSIYHAVVHVPCIKYITDKTLTCKTKIKSTKQKVEKLKI